MASFGAQSTDEHSPTDSHPGLSMITGLAGNALGLDYTDTPALQSIQDRLLLATAALKPGTLEEDFQTAELDPDVRLWAASGPVRDRKACSRDAFRGPTLRRRRYLADVDFLAAIALDPPGGQPSLLDLARAFHRPARGLSLGRADFPPSRPVFQGVSPDPDPRAVLDRLLAGRPAPARWSAALGDPAGDAASRPVHDLKTWQDAIHQGSRLVYEGQLGCALPA